MSNVDYDKYTVLLYGASIWWLRDPDGVWWSRYIDVRPSSATGAFNDDWVGPLEAPMHGTRAETGKAREYVVADWLEWMGDKSRCPALVRGGDD